MTRKESVLDAVSRTYIEPAQLREYAETLRVWATFLHMIAGAIEERRELEELEELEETEETEETE